MTWEAKTGAAEDGRGLGWGEGGGGGGVRKGGRRAGGEGRGRGEELGYGNGGKGVYTVGLCVVEGFGVGGGSSGRYLAKRHSSRRRA